MRKRLLCAAGLTLLAAACAPPPARKAEIPETIPPPPMEIRGEAPRPERPVPPPPETEARPPAEPEGDMVLAYRSGDYRAVVEGFARIEERFPAHRKGPDDLYLLGMSNFFLGEDTKALRYFLEFQYRFGEDRRIPEIHLMTARVFRRLGRTDKALESLDEAVALAGAGEVRVGAWEEKADMLAGEGQYLASLEVLDEAYRRASTGEIGRISMRIRELLAVVPVDVIEDSIVGRSWSFPRKEIMAVYSPKAAAESRPPPEAEPPEEGEERVPARIPELRYGDLPRVDVLPGGDDIRPVVRIGVMAPTEGRTETWGTDLRRGVELMLEEVSGPSFPFRVEAVYAGEGPGEDEEQSLSSMVVSDGIVALVGPLLSGTVEKVLPVAEEHSLAVLSPTASSPRLSGKSPNFFRNCFTLEQFSRSLAVFAREVLGLGRFAVFAPEDIYGQSFAEYFSGEFVERGGEIVASERFDVELTDYAGPIGALKREAGIPDPLPEEGGEEGGYPLPFDGLFVPGYAESVGLVLPQLAFHDVDLKQLAVIGGGGLNSRRLAEIGEEYAEGVIFVDGFFAASPRPEVQQFVGRYRERYGEEPGTFAAQAYDAAAILVDAIRRGAAGRAEMLQALGTMSGFRGVTGWTVLRPGGYMQRQPFFGTVAGGGLVSLEVSPPPSP